MVLVVVLLYGAQFISVVLSETHSLIGTHTAVNANKFTSVLWLDGEMVDSYRDSGTVSVPRRNWMREGHGHGLWTSIKHFNVLQWNRGRVDILKSDRGLNTSGAAVLQGRFGCEIERTPDSHVRLTGTFAEYRLNGGDFLSLNLTRHEWEASAESAAPIGRDWNRNKDAIKHTAYYLEKDCVTHLLDTLVFDAKESPTTSPVTAAVFAKRSNCTAKVVMTCLVTGVCRGNLTAAMYRDEGILTEEDGLRSSGIRPNCDGTCQIRMSMDISNRIMASYSCEAHFGTQRKHAEWDGVIRNVAEPGHDCNTRRHYWVLVVSLVVLFISIVGLVCKCVHSCTSHLADGNECE